MENKLQLIPLCPGKEQNKAQAPKQIWFQNNEKNATITLKKSNVEDKVEYKDKVIELSVSIEDEKIEDYGDIENDEKIEENEKIEDEILTIKLTS